MDNKVLIFYAAMLGFCLGMLVAALDGRRQDFDSETFTLGIKVGMAFKNVELADRIISGGENAKPD
ncbi:MAG: hypothetical protein M0Z48_04415 [Nitrospiraceae bacterium]|nr:hypothetical protein [Nitrospiraceae bacterium]